MLQKTSTNNSVIREPLDPFNSSLSHFSPFLAPEIDAKVERGQKIQALSKKMATQPTEKRTFQLVVCHLHDTQLV